MIQVRAFDRSPEKIGWFGDFLLAMRGGSDRLGVSRRRRRSKLGNVAVQLSDHVGQKRIMFFQCNLLF